MTDIDILSDRKRQINKAGTEGLAMECEKHSLAGAVSQRACVFCGSRVVLYPVTDALHLIHGPIGCAAYTWDIRGALSSGPQLHRMSFSTDLREMDVIHGGENKLYKSLIELIDKYNPKAAFVYSTCVVGVIGDDVASVCARVKREKGIPVIAVHSEGFKGSKKDGYKAACDALLNLVGTLPVDTIPRLSVNILGDFNIAGESWIIKNYYEKMGIRVVSTITGDARVKDIMQAHGASLNIVQCSGSMTWLAQQMESNYGIPYIRASYFGIEDTAKALYDVADFFDDPELTDRARKLVRCEVEKVIPQIKRYSEALRGKKAAVYVGGAFKAFSLIKSLRMLNMDTVVVGSQTGNKSDYEVLKAMCNKGTIIVDDANTLELARFILEKDVDLFIGGVKERPIAYKLGVGFCDHNHERKIALAGFEGMVNFSREVFNTVTSPVWKFVPRRQTKKEVYFD
ncbi:nitrogenase iron-molybdenum cofactor biosynthesis protein NifE [Cellulosispirillum alkaliphilum]|uniref:nitrogenase iron-molybdenum cofactor biosynthesis protein NifE n=1 Tax=Cellulosispirillum alkaliphilum TaxID=3039283 RepID=UPI003D6E1813